MRYLILLIALCLASASGAQTVDVARFGAADVIILGEVHDNPRHHAAQAEVVAAVAPAAIVFEMLTTFQADLVTDENRHDRAALREALVWDDAGWPDFSYYFPIFSAGADARIYGANLTRSAAHRAFKIGVMTAFGPEAGLYGLDQQLSDEEQSAREAFQLEAHCNGLPVDMLARMVDLQRLRDAQLARAAVIAFEAVGGPVVVITGNGHARKDRGLATYLHAVRPDVRLYAVGMAEDGRIDGVFDQVVSFAAQPRPDPCAAFQKSD